MITTVIDNVHSGKLEKECFCGSEFEKINSKNVIYNIKKQDGRM